MKKLLPIFILFFAFTSFGQIPKPSPEPDKDYPTTQPGDPYLQALPSDEKVLSEADAGNVYQCLGILAAPEMGEYELIFVNVQEDFQFEGQRSQLFNLYVYGEKVGSYMPTVVKKFAGKKYKAEYLTVEVDYNAIQKILGATDVSIAYGRIAYKATADNLTAFRSIKDRYDARAVFRRPNPANLVYWSNSEQSDGNTYEYSNNYSPSWYYRSSTTYTSRRSRYYTNAPIYGRTQRVNGYYRSNGTYVRQYYRRPARRRY